VGDGVDVGFVVSLDNRITCKTETEYGKEEEKLTI
jgi:hypothetical protein